MTAEPGQPPVGNEEWLARFIVRKEHVRPDGTVKPDPFIPYKWVELSVTRHTGLSEEQLWSAGEVVASQIEKSLQGRGDTQAKIYVRQRLRVDGAPVAENKNHANVVGWPQDKQAQKEIAIELVKDVRFVPVPSRTI
jgi:hypothetical protein